MISWSKLKFPRTIVLEGILFQDCLDLERKKNDVFSNASGPERRIIPIAPLPAGVAKAIIVP